MNEAAHVKRLLQKRGVRTESTEDRVRAMLNCIGQKGVTDAFYLDTAAIYEQLGEVWKVRSTPRRTRKTRGKLPELGWQDDETGELTRRAGRVEVQRVHRRMTNALVRLFGPKIRRGRAGPGQFDALLPDYRGDGRHLLLEVKSLIDRNAARLAVGQLFDYRHYTHDPAMTEMAVLFPKRPSKRVREYLSRVGVKALWFPGVQYQRIDGDWQFPSVVHGNRGG